jgi:hypothetical protein
MERIAEAIILAALINKKEQLTIEETELKDQLQKYFKEIK